MPSREHRKFFAGLRVTGLGTLASRILGMVRDMATAALFGLAAGGVMDAFVVAFRIPNLFRRLFGEGALSASYLPVLSARLEDDRRSAWKLTSVILTWLTVILLGLFLVAEAVCLLIYMFWGEVPGVSLLIGLTAALLPYMVLICLTAQIAATLQALGHFTMPALAPVVLNVCWLLGVWVAAAFFTDDKHAQAYVLAVSVLLGGAVQLGMQLPPLLRHGFRFDYDWAASASAVGQVVRAVLPMMFGLAVTQVNTLLDVLIAWGLAAAPDGPQTILWLRDAVDYPMRQGAAASVYYGERMYQFPVGLLGVTVATVIFPLLSRHAARGMRERIGQDLTLGLRLVWLLALPASVGLVLLAGPIARLLFQHGEFTPDDARRTAHMIAAYGLGVWAYCALPVMVRGYYALGLRTTPVKIAAATVALNLLLNLTLIWPLAEVGLAVSTALSAAVQAVVLVVVFSRQGSPLAWRDLATTAVAALVAATLMGLACWITLRQLPPVDGLVGRMLDVLLPLAVGGVVYFAFLRFLWPRELALLLGRDGTAVDRRRHFD